MLTVARASLRRSAYRVAELVQRLGKGGNLSGALRAMSPNELLWEVTLEFVQRLGDMSSKRFKHWDDRRCRGESYAAEELELHINTKVHAWSAGSAGG